MAVILTGVRCISLWFWFPFPWWLVILSIFSCICWPSVCLSWRSVYSGPLTIFYFILLVYIFILAELSLCFSAWAFSNCTSQGLLWLQCAAFSCYRAWTLECTGSVVAMHGLSCPMACGILVPQPEIEPISPALEGEFLTTGPLGSSEDPGPLISIIIFLIIGLLGFFILCGLSSLYTLNINPLSDILFANILSHLVGSLFCFVDSFLCCTKKKSFQFDVVWFVYFCFCSPCLRKVKVLVIQSCPTLLRAHGL